MSKFKLPVLLVMLAAFSMPALAGEKVVKRVPAGAVAFHFVFELSFLTGQPEFMGYIGFIEGVDAPLFNGPPSKDTAHFTLRVPEGLPMPFGLPVPDTELTALVYPPGGLAEVYFNPNPDGREWTDPDSFSEGVLIAVLDESALMSVGAATASFNLFSARVIDSTPIRFKGQKIDFKKLVPNGVTITNFGNGIRPDFSGGSGGGTAIAIGGKLRDKSDDDD